MITAISHPVAMAAYVTDKNFFKMAGGYMSLGAILIIVLILILLGVIPTWPYSRNWGYAPSGALGTILLILLILYLLGQI